MRLSRSIAVLLQPDGVQRSLVGKIITRFEERGYKLIALKLVHATPEHLEKRSFFPSSLLASSPINP